MLRRESVIVAVLCLLCSCVGVASAATYTITDLGVTGSGIGYVDTYNGQPVVVEGGGWYWTRASAAVNVTPLLPAGWGATSCTVAGVNSSGQIDGTYYTAASGANIAGAFVYTIGGTAQQINFPSESFITTGVEGVTNVSEDGSVALYYGTGSPPGTAACPALYNANTQTFTYPGGTATSGTGYGVLPEVMNANDWIGGENGTAEVWNGSTWNTVPPYGTGTNYAYGMDSHGDIVGKDTHSGYNAIYAAYNGGTWGTPIDLFSGTTKGVGFGINDNQVIVGYSSTLGVAEIWNTPTTGSNVALSTLVTNLSTWTLAEATGINNAGEIVGYGTNPSGTASEAFLLTPTPTPEPSTLLLAALGLGGLVAYAWRKRK